MNTKLLISTSFSHHAPHTKRKTGQSLSRVEILEILCVISQYEKKSHNDEEEKFQIIIIIIIIRFNSDKMFS